MINCGGKKGYSKGGKVTKTAAMEDAYNEQKVKYARVPLEPVSGQEPDALSDAMRYEDRREGKVQRFALGGGVCAGGRSAIRGLKFSGTS